MVVKVELLTVLYLLFVCLNDLIVYSAALGVKWGNWRFAWWKVSGLFIMMLVDRAIHNTVVGNILDRGLRKSMAVTVGRLTTVIGVSVWLINLFSVNSASLWKWLLSLEIFQDWAFGPLWLKLRRLSEFTHRVSRQATPDFVSAIVRLLKGWTVRTLGVWKLGV